MATLGHLCPPISWDDSPYPNLPPLAALTDAGQVKRDGSSYSFVLPSVSLPAGWGWIAYAPLSGAELVGGSPASVAYDAPGRAVVKGGLVISLIVPQGMVAGGTANPPMHWTLFNFGRAPAIALPGAQ